MNARVSMRQNELAPGSFARDTCGARDQLGLAGACREHHGHIRCQRKALSISINSERPRDTKSGHQPQTASRHSP